MSNNEIFDLYKSHKVQAMFKKFMARYAKSIPDYDERDSICNMAFVLTLKKHDNSKQEFTSSLFNFLTWKFNTAAVRQKNELFTQIPEGVEYVAPTDEERKNNLLAVAEYSHILTKNQKLILYNILCGNNLRITADLMNIKYHKARQLFTNAVERLQMEVKDVSGC